MTFAFFNLPVSSFFLSKRGVYLAGLKDSEKEELLESTWKSEYPWWGKYGFPVGVFLFVTPIFVLRSKLDLPELSVLSVESMVFIIGYAAYGYVCHAAFCIIKLVLIEEKLAEKLRARADQD